jgi:BirA family transcriptional regulator, biotin operon repressor / biotin---[acetyl-CoA-carboxylase] ligase
MIGAPRAHFRVTDSTNEQAKALAEHGAPHGTLVTADEQTAGRGRQGRVWTAPPRSSLLMSLVLRELEERHALLPLAASVAVCEALDPLDCRIKWPNDVWIGRRKAAGILVEGRPQAGWAVLGIGLNVNLAPGDFPPELRETATSVAIASGERRDLEQTLDALLASLEAWMAAPGRKVLAAWRERDALRGERVSWDGGDGTAAGIDDSGALRVQTPEGEVVKLEAGEIHLSGLR